MAGGSVSTVHYSGVGAGSMPKERVEVLRGGRSWVLDDFRALTTYDDAGERTEAARRVDKGHAALLAGVLDAARGTGDWRPGLEAAYAAQSVALAVLDAAAAGTGVEVARPGTATPPAG